MKTRTRTRCIFFAVCALLHAASGHAETATIVSVASLYQRPAYDAPVTGRLEAGLTVEQGERSGGWKQVTTSDHSGWVRSYQVRTGDLTTTRQESSSGGFLGGLASLSRKATGLFSGNRNNGRRSYESVATIGVRGLSEEEIRNASPDFDELVKMETFRITDRKAKVFAKEGRRTAVKLTHMPRSGAEE